jgi:hypothetical protein
VFVDTGRNLSRYDDNGHSLCETVRRHLAEHVSAVKTGQAKIEDHSGWGVRIEVNQGVEAIRNTYRGIAFGAECGAEQIAGLTVVFNNQDDRRGGACSSQHLVSILLTFFHPQTQPWHSFVKRNVCVPSSTSHDLQYRDAALA